MRIVIPGNPVPKGRPRFRVARSRGAFGEKPKEWVQTYNDAQTERGEQRVRKEAFKAMEGREQLIGPVWLKLEFYVPIPQSFSQVKREKANHGEILPVTRPDIDNYEKLICDALNGIVYQDDNQIVHSECVKRYSDNPGTIIEAGEYQPEPRQSVLV